MKEVHLTEEGVRRAKESLPEVVQSMAQAGRPELTSDLLQLADLDVLSESKRREIMATAYEKEAKILQAAGENFQAITGRDKGYLKEAEQALMTAKKLRDLNK